MPTTYAKLLPLLLPLTTALACGDKDQTGSDDTGTSDGGTTATTTYDEGCITVDGAGGYAWANDAIAVGGAGAVISFEGCEAGTHSEDIVVDQAVTLVGHPDLVLEAEDDTPLKVTADGAVVEGLALRGEEVALLVEGAADVQLQDLVIEEAGTWAVHAIDATGLSLTGATISGADDGGVRIEGGSARIADCALTGLKGYGVLASDDAVVSVEGCTLDGISASSLSADDGVGIAGDEAALSTDGNVLTDVARYGILAVGGSLSLSGDRIEGSSFGVLASDADLVGTDLAVTDAFTCGIYAYAPSLVELTGVDVVGTPGVVLDVDPDAWGDAAYQSTGVFVVAPDTVVSDTSISGYSGAGMLIAANAGGVAELSAVTLADQGHYGLYISEVDTSAEDVVVSGTYATTDALDDLCSDVGSDVGVLIYGADLDWSGGSVTDVEGYGISGIYGNVEIDGLTVSGTSCGGVMAFQGDASITYSSFSNASGGPFAGSIVSYQGGTLYVGGSTFSDSQNELLDRSTESIVGGVLTRYEYYEWAGSDIQVWYGADATIHQNSFERGVNGVELYGDASYGYSTATLSNNSFTDYLGLATYVGAGCSATISDQEVSGHGPYTLACEDGSLDLTRVTVQDGGTSVARTAVYEDDVFVYDLELESTGPSVFSSSCDLSADTLTIRDADATALYLQSGSWELEDLVISGAGLVEEGDGIYAVARSGSSTLYLDGAEITGVASGRGLYLGAATATSATVFDGKVSDTALQGLYLDNATGSSSSASATLTRVTVSGAGSTGLYAEDFGLSLDSVDVSSGGDDGLYLAGGTVGISESTAKSNAGYGMVCAEGVGISSCDLDASDNGEGSFDGCGSPCQDDDEADTGAAD